MIIPARFNGPPGSGNGGYSCGVVAHHLTSRHPDRRAVEVTLRHPPPLDTELTPTLTQDLLRVHHGQTLIAEAVPATVGDDEVVAPVDFAEAVALSASYRGFASHPFPTCYVCGPDRADGLRLFPGRDPAHPDRTAAPFVAPPDVSELTLWAALDCPSGWAVPMETRAYLLGRFAVRLRALPEPGAACVVMGQFLREEGRRAYARSTVYAPDGAILATARATWVALAH